MRMTLDVDMIWQKLFHLKEIRKVRRLDTCRKQWEVEGNRYIITMSLPTY